MQAGAGGLSLQKTLIRRQCLNLGRDWQTQTSDMPPLARPQRQSFAVAFVVGFLTACVTLWSVRPKPGASDVLTSLSGAQSAGGLSLWQAEDAKYLGPQKGDTPPARLDNYKYKTNEYQVRGVCARSIVTPSAALQSNIRLAPRVPVCGTDRRGTAHLNRLSAAIDPGFENMCSQLYHQEIYDKSWLAGGYPKQSCWGCRFGVDVITRLPFHSVLDAGTGNGALVRLMREHGEHFNFWNSRAPLLSRRSQPPLRPHAAGSGSRCRMQLEWSCLRWQPLSTGMHRAGKSAWGIELSDAVLKSECPDLLTKKVSAAAAVCEFAAKCKFGRCMHHCAPRSNALLAPTRP